MGARARALALVAASLAGCGTPRADELATATKDHSPAKPRAQAKTPPDPGAAAAPRAVISPVERPTPPLPVHVEPSPKAEASLEPAAETHDELVAPLRAQGPVSFLLIVGVDRARKGVTGRSDTLMVVALRHRDLALAAFSLPRDLWIEIPDRGPARLNSVLRIGDLERGTDGGTRLLRERLAEELGVEIDRHLIVDFAAFDAILERTGGVELDVPCPIRDCFWTDEARETGECEMLDLDAGPQHLGAHEALLYARSRHGRGDHDRTRRQQAIVSALAHSLRRRSWTELMGMWRAVAPHLRTDLPVEELAAFARILRRADLGRIGGFAVKHPMTQRHVTEDNKHVLLLDRTLFDAAMESLFEGRAPGLEAPRRCVDKDAALEFRSAD